MKKQASAEKKAKKPAKNARGRQEEELPEATESQTPLLSDSQPDYRELLLEIKKELKELRNILEG